MHESFPPNKKNQGIEKFISPCSVDVDSIDEGLFHVL